MKKEITYAHFKGLRFLSRLTSKRLQWQSAKKIITRNAEWTIYESNAMNSYYAVQKLHCLLDLSFLILGMLLDFVNSS